MVAGLVMAPVPCPLELSDGSLEARTQPGQGPVTGGVQGGRSQKVTFRLGQPWTEGPRPTPGLGWSRQLWQRSLGASGLGVSRPKE